MAYEDLYLDVNSSILKLCKDFITDNALVGFQVFDFDAHASLNDLPNNHLVGVAEYSLMENSDSYEGECMLIICTKQDDANLKILKPVVSKLFSRVKAGKEIPLVQSTNALVLGNLKLKPGSEAMPVSRTESRPLIAINISFGLALISPP